MGIVDDYKARMWRDCPQFKHFGIQPRFEPGTGDIWGFCHDEVVRQFHDTRLLNDGGVRVKGMESAWLYAKAVAPEGPPRKRDILHIAYCCEPERNKYGLRVQGVWIGGRQGAPWGILDELLDALLNVLTAKRVPPGGANVKLIESYTPANFTERVRDVATVDDWYLAFEWIHPFIDGNGRTGKVLHNWLNGTLAEPVLVSDYFGGGNP